ncbi:MAG TPA: PIG-L deacetylase family protein [Steroidobacteraceae bacterium]|nr:PIG-L deacetylase family protein [Steroidobacteraceae bacterium]
MQRLKFERNGAAPTVVCIGAHCDDIEIGCGGTLARWAREYSGATFVWGIFASEGVREHESRAAAARLLEGAGRCELRFHDFRASYFPAQLERIKDAFEVLKAEVRPDVVLTHRLEDRHQDHRVLAELTWNTFRSHLILEYEIPKYEGDLGHPNVFVPLDAPVLDHKVRVLMESFPSQRSRQWFTEDTFRALARLRGLECNAPSGYAEAFHARKVCL